MKLVVAVDGRQSANTALEFVRKAHYASGTQVHLLHVLVPGFADVQVQGLPDLVAQEKASAGAVLAEMKAALHDDPGWNATTQMVSGETAEVVAEACRQYEADEVIVPTHARRGFSHLWFGSVADEIVQAAPCTSIVLAMHRK